MEAGEYGQMRGTCVSLHADPSWERSQGCCGFRGGFGCGGIFSWRVLYHFVFFECRRPAVSMRPACLMYLSATNGSCQRVGGLFIFSISAFLSVIQHRFRLHRSTALNAHGTNASPDGLCAHAHTSTNKAFPCSCCSKSCRLVEPGAATRVFRGMAGSCFRRLECTMYEVTIPLCFCFALETFLPTDRP